MSMWQNRFLTTWSPQVYAYSVDALIIIAPETFQHQTGEKLGNSAAIFPIATRWAPTSYKWSYNHEFVGL